LEVISDYQYGGFIKLTFLVYHIYKHRIVCFETCFLHQFSPGSLLGALSRFYESPRQSPLVLTRHDISIDEKDLAVVGHDGGCSGDGVVVDESFFLGTVKPFPSLVHSFLKGCSAVWAKPLVSIHISLSMLLYKAK